MRRAQLWMMTLGGILLAAEIVSAHGLAVYNGKIVFDDRTMMISLDDDQPRGHRHSSGEPEKRDVLRDVLAALDVYDETGTTVALHITQDRATTEADVAGRFVALRWRGVSDGQHDRARLVLRIRHGGGSTQIVLTSGGNVEVVRLGQQDDGEGQADNPGSISCEPVGKPDVHAVWHRIDEDMVVDVYVPAGILETWIPIPRPKESVLTAEDLNAVEQSTTHLFRQQILIRTGDRKRHASDVSIRIIDPDGRHRDRSCFWMAKVHVQLHYANLGNTPMPHLEWQLFNNVIHHADVLVRTSDSSVTKRVSRYDPTIAWGKANHPTDSRSAKTQAGASR